MREKDGVSGATRTVSRRRSRVTPRQPLTTRSPSEGQCVFGALRSTEISRRIGISRAAERREPYVISKEDTDAPRVSRQREEIAVADASQSSSHPTCVHCALFFDFFILFYPNDLQCRRRGSERKRRRERKRRGKRSGNVPARVGHPLHCKGRDL